MQQLVGFFETMPSSYRTLALVGGLCLFWILEGAVPLFTKAYRKVPHAAVNLLLTLFQLILALAFGASIVWTSQYTTAHRIGVFYLIDLPLWLHTALGVLLLDCIAGYWIHRLEHRFGWLWRFHIIHHSDKHVDVTTGLRHHPAETIFRLSSQLLAVAIGGIPLGILFLYQITSVFFAQLTHANIRIPTVVDRTFSWIVVTPGMHKVHHHLEKPLTDSNYGNVFSIWDRLFGTFVYADPATLEYGIDSLAHRSDEGRVSSLLMLPFETRASSRK